VQLKVVNRVLNVRQERWVKLLAVAGGDGFPQTAMPTSLQPASAAWLRPRASALLEHQRTYKATLVETHLPFIDGERAVAADELQCSQPPANAASSGNAGQGGGPTSVPNPYPTVIQCQGTHTICVPMPAQCIVSMTVLIPKH
jgi:hypothetical protein